MDNIDFPLIMVWAVFITGVITLIDRFFFAKKRKIALKQYKKNSHHIDEKTINKIGRCNSWIEFSKEIFPILLLVLLLRSFLFEPFKIPSGSMIPSLRVGDFILVNKFEYGLRLPVTGTKIWENKEPKRGDVLVFREPIESKLNYIKRVIGIPGDHIQYINKELIINGKIIESQVVEKPNDPDQDSGLVYQENLDDITHEIKKYGYENNILAEGEWVVPKGMYFVMGDNRDRSNDSRFWGFVPEDKVLGKAVYVWLNWSLWSELPTFNQNRVIH